MDKIQISAEEISSDVLQIGFEGENDHTQVIIYCSTIINNYPNAVASMVIQPPVGDMYPKDITQDGNKIVWVVTASDCAYPGAGRYQLTFTDDNEVIKTYIGNYNIKDSLIANGEPPTPLEDWLEQAQEALDAFKQDVSDAEAWAVGTRNGEPVSSSDPTYHNNAKYYADHISMTVDGTTLILSTQ